LNGNCVKLVDIKDGSVRYLETPGNGIATLTVNSSYGYIAFGENGLNARIFIYNKNNLDEPLIVIPGKLYVQIYHCKCFS